MCSWSHRRCSRSARSPESRKANTGLVHCLALIRNRDNKREVEYRSERSNQAKETNQVKMATILAVAHESNWLSDMAVSVLRLLCVCVGLV